MTPTKNYISIILVVSLFACKTKKNSDKSEKSFLVKHPDASIKRDEHSQLDTLTFNSKDTFRIHNIAFRILRHSQSKDIEIQFFKNYKWHDNVDVEVHDQLETSLDWNYDGYNDIFSQSQGWNYINYYLPEKKLFSQQFKMPGDGEVSIDKSKNLFANYREPYHICNYYNSQLIDYTKTVPTLHFLLSGETFMLNNECIIDSIKILKLFKYNQQKDSLIFLESYTPKNPKKFEYELFWKKNYKRLMGYHQQ